MDFDTLIASLEAGDIEKAKAEAGELKPKFETTVNELKAYESKLADAVGTRDKSKGKLKDLAEALGINAEDMTAESVKELIKVGKNDDTYKAEIDNLTKLLKTNSDEYGIKLQDADTRFRDKMIEVEISKIGLNADIVNDKALSLVIGALKDGASLENGEITYKDKDGAIQRDSSGRPINVSGKMEAFKSDDTNSFLFKPTSNGGGGSQTTRTIQGKTMTREAFDNLNPQAKGAFMANDGTVT